VRRARRFGCVLSGRMGSREAESGITLIEMVVAMSLMSILMSIFVTAVVQMYRTANHTEATSRTQSQVALAFMRLDREIRYAGGVTEPKGYGSDWYVEYLTTNVAEPLCTRLRLSGGTGRLERLTWPQDGHPGNTWTTLVTDLTVPTADAVAASTAAGTQPADAPFSLLSGKQYSYQALVVVLSANGAGGESAEKADLRTTFAALNSTSNAATADCQEGRPSS
jgi:prepilin-type N-terminal cleavage/methylation domain-containing protein